ncbi:kinesin-domain-containing protein [Hesseltinella vesiculosa]|uniref:Kinesin-domain-containing protein n=1 Tax=Hesseltinella vesiculosa TaxID=101127 RepID=A0A1X2GTQ7_9FUNG|nr:kinesin-domain-containing protein [Hesseltinella vesiculosa]
MTSSSSLPSPTSSKDQQTTTVQVAIRVRPLTEQDRLQPRFSNSTDSDVIKTFGNTATIVPHQKSYSFDHVFDTESTQEQVFNGVASKLVDRFLDGYNVTILAYGQTSSGKTYTMGTALDMDQNVHPEEQGIIPRAVSSLFERLQPSSTPSPTSRHSTLPSATSTFPPQSGARLPRRAYSSSRLRPVSMINTAPDTTQPPRRGSAPLDVLTQNTTRHTIHVSFVEIYNEELIDLLNPAPAHERPPATIREDTKGQIRWTGVKELPVENTEDVLRYLQMGTDNRATGSTDMNAKSSRSHAIFSVTLKQEKWVPFAASSKSTGRNSKRDLTLPVSSKSSMINRRGSSLNVRAMVGQMERQDSQSPTDDDDQDGEWMVSHSKFHFVDLAGSERLKRTAAEGDRRKEGININAGLLALGNVISALAMDTTNMASSKKHIPYRDSKLTRLLQDSLGGNATTLMIACVSPAEINLTETANTIKYAHRARNIKNKAERNETEEWMTNDSPDYLRSLITKLKTELRGLKSQQTRTHQSTSPTQRQRSVNSAASSPETPTLCYPISPSPSSPGKVSTSTSSAGADDLGAKHVTEDVDVQMHHVVSDYRRQIEELQNELIVTRERNQWVESQLGSQLKKPWPACTSVDDLDPVHKQNDSRVSNGSQDSALGSMDFQQLVEPVIEEYEKSISGLESQLALARAALTHSDDALLEQERKMTEFTTLRQSEQDALHALKDRLAKMLEREQSTERYVMELETKLATSSEKASEDHDVLTSLKNKIMQFQEHNTTTEQYIESLETKLAKAEEDHDRWNVLVEAAEKRIALQEEHISMLNQKLELADHAVSSANNDAQEDDSEQDQESLMQQIEASESQHRELQQTLASIKRYSVMSLSAMVSDLQVGVPSAKASTSSLTSVTDINNDADLSSQDLREQLVQKETLIHALQSKLDDMGDLHQQLADLRHQHASAIASLEKETDALKEQHTVAQEEWQQQHEQALAKTQSLQTELEASQADHQDIFDKHTSLQKQLWDHEQGTRITLRRRLEEAEQLKTELAALQQVELKQDLIISVFEQKLADLEATVTQLQQQLHAKEDLVATLEKDNHAKTSQLDDLQQQVGRLLRDLAGLGVQRKQLDMIIAWMDKSLHQHDLSATASLATLGDLKQMHTLRDADYEEKARLVVQLEAQVAELTSTVETSDVSTRRLTKELTSVKVALQDELERAQGKDIDLQRVAAMESRVIELDKVVDVEKKKRDELTASLAAKEEALTKANASLERQQTKVSQLEKQLTEAMASMEKERELVSANDTSGLIAELEEKLQVLQRARQLDQDEFDVRFDRAMDDLEDSRRAYKEQSHMIMTLEDSVQTLQSRLDEAVASHTMKATQLQQMQEQLRRRPSLSSTGTPAASASNSSNATASTSASFNLRRARADSSTSNASSATHRFLADVEEEEEEDSTEREAALQRSPSTVSPASSKHQSYDVTSLLRQLDDQERLIKEKDDALFKLEQSQANRHLPSAARERMLAATSITDQDGNQVDVNTLPREALVDLLGQANKDKTQLLLQLDDLEAQMVAQRDRHASDSKRLEMDMMKLTAANDRLEKEMEQVIPRPAPMPSVSSSHSMHSSHHPMPTASVSTGSIISATSPPQTPRAMSPTHSASSSLKMSRNMSITALSKLQKSNSLNGVRHHSLNQQVGGQEDDTPSRPPSVLRTSMDRPPSSLASYRAIPPPSAPPCNPLPPIPTTPLPSPPSPPSSHLQRNNSTHTHMSDATHVSSIATSQQSNLTTADQYDKLLRSLQRKAQAAETDVRAHQEVISKLEMQLSRSEVSVRDAKKQVEVLTREKQAYTLEIQNLRSQVTQIMSQQKVTTDEAGDKRKQLEVALEQERKYKEKAEKARMILENRMEELMNKKNKFMCF